MIRLEMRNCSMILIEKQLKYQLFLQVKFNELVDERLKKITDLDKKVNSDYLKYRYKGNITDVKFNEFDNALDIIDKIRDGKIDLANVKRNKRNVNIILEK